MDNMLKEVNKNIISLENDDFKIIIYFYHFPEIEVEKLDYEL